MDGSAGETHRCSWRGRELRRTPFEQPWGTGHDRGEFTEASGDFSLKAVSLPSQGRDARAGIPGSQCYSVSFDGIKLGLHVCTANTLQTELSSSQTPDF